LLHFLATEARSAPQWINLLQKNKRRKLLQYLVPEVLGDDEFDVEHGDEGEELDDHAIQALLDGINDADATVEEDAIEQFDDFRCRSTCGFNCR